MIFSPGISPPSVGSTGGITFKGDRGTSVARARSMPVDPKASRQVNMRPSFAGAAQYWKLCTPTQQSAWETYAAAVPLPAPGGGSHFVSGFAMFCRSCMIALQHNNWIARFPGFLPVPLPFDAPTDFDLGPQPTSISNPTVFSFEAFFDWTLDQVSDGDAIYLLYVGRLMNSGEESYHSWTQFAHALGLSPGTLNQVVFVSSTVNPEDFFSTSLPAVGAYQLVRLLVYNFDGRLSLPFSQIVQWQAP
jgi:hypothetical protein